MSRYEKLSREEKWKIIFNSIKNFFLDHRHKHITLFDVPRNLNEKDNYYNLPVAVPRKSFTKDKFSTPSKEKKVIIETRVNQPTTKIRFWLDQQSMCHKEREKLLEKWIPGWNNEVSNIRGRIIQKYTFIDNINEDQYEIYFSDIEIFIPRLINNDSAYRKSFFSYCIKHKKAVIKNDHNYFLFRTHTDNNTEIFKNCFVKNERLNNQKLSVALGLKYSSVNYITREFVRTFKIIGIDKSLSDMLPRSSLIQQIDKGVYEKIYESVRLFDVNDLNASLEKSADFKSYILQVDQTVLKNQDQYYVINLKDTRYSDILFNRLFAEGKKDTLAALGQKYSVTRERIRQLEAKFIKELSKSGLDFSKIGEKIKVKNIKSRKKEYLEHIIQYYKRYKEVYPNKEQKALDKNYNVSTRTKIRNYTNDLFNNYKINKSLLSNQELLFVEKIIVDLGPEESKYYYFNCPTSISEKTYIILIEEFIELNGEYPRNRSTVRGYEEFLALKIQNIVDNIRNNIKINPIWRKKFKTWGIGIDRIDRNKRDKDKERFYKSLSSLREFVMKYNRLPYKDGGNPNENYLSGFYRSKKQQFSQGYIQHYKEDFDKIEKEISDYLKKHEKAWIWNNESLKKLFQFIAKEKLHDIKLMPSRQTVKKYGKEFDKRFIISSVINNATGSFRKEKTLSWVEVGKKYGFEKIQIQKTNSRNIVVMNINDLLSLDKELNN